MDHEPLPEGIGWPSEDRTVRGLMLWRRHGPNRGVHGKNYRMTSFIYAQGDGRAHLHPLSPGPVGDTQTFWEASWAGLEVSTLGNQNLIYEFFTADSVDLAETHVGHRIEYVRQFGMFPGEPLQVPRPAAARGPQPGPGEYGPGEPETYAASWALAATLLERLDAGYTVVEQHHGAGGQSDTLVVSDLQDAAPRVEITRGGSVEVHGEGRVSRLMDGDGWSQLASGQLSVHEVAHKAAAHLRTPGHSWSGVNSGVALLADISRESAIASSGLRVESGYLDSSSEESGSWTGLYEQFAPVVAIPNDGATHDGIWFVLTAVGDPVLCVNIRSGQMLAPKDPDWQPAIMSPAVRKIIATHAGSGPKTTFGLPVLLSKFNRKERFFLFVDATRDSGHELHEPSMPLRAEFRRRLSQEIGRDVPAHAYAAVDYHLNWLHAALQWKAGKVNPYSKDESPQFNDQPVAPVSGTAEDIDMLIAWTGEDGVANILLLEAKATGAWSNSQMHSKIPRIRTIIGRAVASQLQVAPVLVLASPTEPSTRLDVEAWPDWALRVDGRPHWVELEMAGPRLEVQRCDADGKANSDGQYWGFKKRV